MATLVVRRPKPVMLKAKVDTILFNLKNFKKMQTKKMSLANIQGKLSRTEMKNIMAGTGGSNCKCYVSCPVGTFISVACDYSGSGGLPGYVPGYVCCHY